MIYLPVSPVAPPNKMTFDLETAALMPTSNLPCVIV
jgi:hypothetical protein